MGGGHVEHRANRGRRGRSGSRHRAPGSGVGRAEGPGEAPARSTGGGTGRFSFSAISTTALVIAAAALMTLGLVARWVSHSEQAGSATPAASTVVEGTGRADARPTAEPSSSSAARRRTTRSSGNGTPTRTVAAEGEPSRELVVVPDSQCHRFLQTRQAFPSVTISVQNACQ